MRFYEALTRRRGVEERASLGEIVQQVMSYQGSQYPIGFGGSLSTEQEQIEPNFAGYIQGVYKRNGPVFACIEARRAVFSQVRFQFRRYQDGQLSDLFGGQALLPLEQPWPNGTTGDLLSRAELDVSLSGNFYGVRLGDRIYRRRPDWMTIVLGSSGEDPDEASLIGYVYQPGGPGSREEPVRYFPEQVIHYAPIPDPIAKYRGQSWIDPILSDVVGDNAATTHKSVYYEKGATPNMIVTMDATISQENAKLWAELFRGEYEGVENAYKTWFLGGGASAQVVGQNLRQNDFKAVQGAGETRIAAAAGVPPIIAGFSEGLDAATYSNYQLAKRKFADTTLEDLWRNFAASAQTVIVTPPGAMLAHDPKIPFLREDAKDEADAQQTQATTIKTLIEAGATLESATAAIISNNMALIEPRPDGMTSIQLQLPGGNQNQAPDQQPAAPPKQLMPANSAQLRAVLTAFLVDE